MACSDQSQKYREEREKNKELFCGQTDARIPSQV